MKAALGLLFVFAVSLAFLVGCAVGVALAVRWLIPGVEIGSALLVGVISTLGTLHFYLKLISVASTAAEFERLGEEDDPVMMMPPGLWRQPNRKKKQRGR